MVHKWAGWLHTPSRVGGPQHVRAGNQISSGPQVGGVTTWSVPHGGSQTLRSRGQNQQWPTSGPGGYINGATTVPYASERGAKSEVARKWARWLHSACRLGVPQRPTTGDKIRSGREVALPPSGSPTLQSGRQNQKWPTSGPGRDITPIAWGFPNAPHRGTKSKLAHKWPCCLGGPQPFRARDKITNGPNPCRMGGPQHFKEEWQNHKWSRNGPGCHMTRAAWGVPNA